MHHEKISTGEPHYHNKQQCSSKWRFIYIFIDFASVLYKTVLKQYPLEQAFFSGFASGNRRALGELESCKLPQWNTFPVYYQRLYHNSSYEPIEIHFKTAINQRKLKQKKPPKPRHSIMI